jgi:hypothetical protein
VSICGSYIERPNNRRVDYGHDMTIPCEGETLEVGSANRAVFKEFFHLTAFVSDVLCGEIILITTTGRGSRRPFLLPSALDIP